MIFGNIHIAQQYGHQNSQAGMALLHKIKTGLRIVSLPIESSDPMTAPEIILWCLR